MDNLKEEVSRLNWRVAELHSVNAGLRHENERLKRELSLHAEAGKSQQKQQFDKGTLCTPNKTKP